MVYYLIFLISISFIISNLMNLLITNLSPIVKSFFYSYLFNLFYF